MPLIDHTPAPPVFYSFPESTTLCDVLTNFIAQTARETIEKKGKFTLAISGGSLPKNLSPLIGRKDVEWDRWHVFYVDERVVPLDHADSNHALCQTELWSKVPIPAENIHTIDPTLLADEPVDLEELADNYQDQLIDHFVSKDAARFPVFDLILLGMGPDGHTASLFPGSAQLEVGEECWVAYIEESPKPPPKRITLTLPVINHAARVAFVATGDSKQESLAITLDEPEKGYPGSRVRPAKPGVVYWFVDDAASALVKYARSDYSDPVSDKPELKV